MGRTLMLAIVATAIGCVIGLACGILQTIPHSKTDHIAKRLLLGLIRVILRAYIEVFRGTPMLLSPSSPSRTLPDWLIA